MAQQEVNATLASDRLPLAAASARSARSTSGSGAVPASTQLSASSTSAPSRQLPKTGSAWPLLALVSILSIVMGLTLTVRRRPMHSTTAHGSWRQTIDSEQRQHPLDITRRKE